MASLRQRGKVLEAVGMTMLEEGRVLNKREYEKMQSRTPVRIGNVLNHFGSWSRMLGILENTLPDVWAEIKEKENPISVPPTPPKPKFKAAVKPAPAVKKDKDDE